MKDFVKEKPDSENRYAGFNIEREIIL